MRICFSFFLLGGIADKRFRLTPIGIDYRCYRSVVCLFVCLSRSCIVHKRQKISTLFLLHTTAPCLSQIAMGTLLKNGITAYVLPPQKNSLKLSAQCIYNGN